MATLLGMRGVSLAFGDSLVLRDVDFAVSTGEVHALLGENGAGKSSLMKVLSGALPPRAGSMQLDGRPFAPADPLAARAAGVAMIYQELTLLPHLSVAANIGLGRECRGRFGWLDRRRALQQAEAALALLEAQGLPLSRPVRLLAPPERQLVEIARALASDARVLVMDEPTSSLGAADVQRLFAVIRGLRARGLGVIYISHFLDEVRAVADRYTVLRDGAVVGSGDIAAVDDDELVRQMVGRAPGELFPSPRPAGAGPPVLEVHGLQGRPQPRDATLQLRSGEVLGIGGLCGAGRTELAEAVFGLRARTAGTVLHRGNPLRPDPRIAWQQRIGFLAEDRKQQGLSLMRSIAANLVLPSAAALARHGHLPPRRLQAVAERWIDDLRIRCRGPWQPVGELSGGNQQKVALARLLHAGCTVLLLDEPTRGVDIGARQEIYALLDQRARAGAAVLLVSSQLEELLGLCDRIAVMCRGRLLPAQPAGAWTRERLLLASLQPEAVA